MDEVCLFWWQCAADPDDRRTNLSIYLCEQISQVGGLPYDSWLVSVLPGH